MWRWGLLSVWLVVSACEACERNDVPTREAVPARGGAQLVRELGALSDPTAFELVATSEGALVVWAPGACEHGLRVRRLAANGDALGPTMSIMDACPEGSADPLAGGRIRELAAAAGGGRLGIAWIAQDAERAWAFGTHAQDDAQAFAPVRNLGEVAYEHDPARGRLTLAASQSGQLRVAMRTPEAACVAQRGRCAHIVSQALPIAPEAARRGTDTREVEHPCPRLLAGALWNAGVWYDAFCVLHPADAAPITQVYAIRPEVYYAEVVPALASCTPLGLAPSATGALLFGRCADELAVQPLAPELRAPDLRGVRPEVGCAQGRPRHALHAASARTIALDSGSPRDRLELLLPPELSPRFARAASTGSRVLITYPEAGVLRLAMLRCQGDALVSDAQPML